MKRIQHSYLTSLLTSRVQHEKLQPAQQNNLRAFMPFVEEKKRSKVDVIPVYSFNHMAYGNSCGHFLSVALKPLEYAFISRTIPQQQNKNGVPHGGTPFFRVRQKRARVASKNFRKGGRNCPFALIHALHSSTSHTRPC